MATVGVPAQGRLPVYGPRGRRIRGVELVVEEDPVRLGLVSWVGVGGCAFTVLAAARVALIPASFGNTPRRGLDGRVAMLILAGASLLMARQAGHHGVNIVVPRHAMAHAHEHEHAGLGLDALVAVGGGAFILFAAGLVHGYDLGGIVAHSTSVVEPRTVFLIVTGAAVLAARRADHNSLLLNIAEMPVVEAAEPRFASWTDVGFAILTVTAANALVLDSSGGFVVLAVACTAAAVLIARAAPVQEVPARRLGLAAWACAASRAFLLLLAATVAVRATLRHVFVRPPPVHPFGASYRDIVADAHLGPVAWARGGARLVALLVASSAAGRAALLIATRRANISIETVVVILGVAAVLILLDVVIAASRLIFFALRTVRQ